MKNAILFHIFLLCICCMACTGTTKEPVADVTLDELPSIFPDYADVTIPPHIAPLRFRLSEPGDGTAFGAGDHKLVERQVSTAAIAGTAFSVAFSLLCVLLATPLLRLLQVPADILPMAVRYLRIVFSGLIFTFFYNFLAAVMRALGDSKSALRRKVR